MEKNEEISLQQLISEFAESGTTIKAALVYRLSDLVADDVQIIENSWGQIPVERRRILMTRLAETSETNFEVDYSRFATFVLQDSDPIVREQAIAALWFSEDPEIMRRIIKMLQDDDSTDVRAAAAEGLGHFVLAVELGDISESLGHDAQEALLEVLNSDDEPTVVHRRALESIAYSGRSEVVRFINAAQNHREIEMQASAIFAMGRTADQRWKRNVMKALDSAISEIRFEAVRAAGELNLTNVVPSLLRLAEDGSDREIQEVAIWSLGEMGGAEAQNALLRLTDRENDEDLLEAIEDAINVAQISAGSFGPILLDDSDEDDIEEMYELDDLDDPDY